MSQITSVLFDSKRRETGDLLGLHFEMDQTGIKCRSARLGSGMPPIAEAKVNSLCFPLEMLLNNALSCAMHSASGPFLLECPGKWKAVLAFYGQKMSVTTDAWDEEAGVVNACAVFLWFLNMPDKERNQNFEHSSQLLASAIRHFRSNNPSEFNLSALEFFDAFFYECGSNYSSVDFVSSQNEVETEIAFGKKDALIPVPLPAEFSDLCEGDCLPVLDGCSQKRTTSEREREEAEIKALYEECLNGKYRIFDCYFPEGQDAVPPLSILRNFRPTREFAQNFRRIYASMCDACGYPRPGVDPAGCLFKDNIRECRCVLNMAWFGPPGTGKSYLCDILAAALGLPVYHIGCSANMEESDFIWSPVADEGGIRMSPTPFWFGYRNGGIVVLDEANLVKPGVLQGVFAKALEKPYELGEKSEHKCSRNPRTVIILTCNPGTAGTQLQNTAFYNRFRSWTQFRPAEEEETILQIYKTLPELCNRPEKEAKIIRQTLTEFYLVYKDLLNGLTRQMADMADVSTVLSSRSLVGAATDMFLYGSQDVFRDKSRRIAARMEAALSSLIEPAVCTVQEKSDEDTVNEFMDKVVMPIQVNLGKDKYPRSRTA